MSKCSICGKRIEMTFLNKMIGTQIKDKKGKKHAICFECQKRYNNDKKLFLAELKLN